MKKFFLALGFIFLYVCVGALTAYLLHISGRYPSGDDTMYHIYRAEFLVESFKSNNFFPLYNPYMYNGVQLFRYFAPASAYGIALFSLAGQIFLPQDAYIGYELYTGFVFFLGALGFLTVGLKKDRLFLGGFLGLLWFFTPSVMYQYFVAGNLTMGFCLACTPYLYGAVFSYIETKDVKRIKQIVLSSAFILLGHVGFGGMVLLALLLFMLLYRLIMLKEEKFSVLSIVFMILTGALLDGIWVLPSLIGGMTSASGTTLAASNFQSLLLTLNPILRLSDGGAGIYFGLVTCLFSVFALLFSRRREKVFFLTALLLLMGSSSVMYPVMASLPGGRYMWMLRFLTPAVILVYFGFLYWKTLRRWIVVLVCALLVLDAVPSYSLLYRGEGDDMPQKYLDAFADEALLKEAKEVTRQRIAVLDQATLTATASYYLLQGEKPVAQSYGAGFEAAYTRDNITLLNTALEQGEYPYLFDRTLALGCDTVLLRISCLREKEMDVDAVVSVAEKIGYAPVKKQGDYLLFSYDTGMEQFGVKSQYEAFGIGSSVGSTTLTFPNMIQGESYYVDDYSFEQLKDYHTLLLDHFSYHNKDSAEALVKRLSDAGVRVVINSDGIPTNQKLQVQEFMGISAMNVSFENGYPILYLSDEVYDLDLFATQYEKWNTTYVNGLDREMGYFYDDGLKLPFLGTVYNENVYALGLNMMFHYSSTHDLTAKDIIEEVMDLKMGVLPQRQIVPMDITYEADAITVDSPEDGVNTTLAWQDNFVASKKTQKEEHLFTVDKGRTEIAMVYPMKRAGAFLTIFGFCLWLILYLILKEYKAGSAE